TGSGVVAASSKAGGILGAGLGVVGFFDHFAWSALLIALPIALSGWMLLRHGIETRGRRLEEIDSQLAAQGWGTRGESLLRLAVSAPLAPCVAPREGRTGPGSRLCTWRIG